jgi:heme/copper-type cytochrome/quinol oxidase subunit 4
MNFKKKIFTLFLLIFSVFHFARAQEYRISLLTCDPGEELYSAFGHSAIRVIDPFNGQDWVFNYGTFNFRTPNFYGKFTAGKLDYMLSVSTYAEFLTEYHIQQRNVREQVLNLNPDQAEFLVEFLQINYTPERRNYRYVFFFNNCATKVRDALELTLGEKLVWNDQLVEEEEKTFRNLIDEYVLRLPWADLGIDLALGAVIDREATPREKQFLPDYMEAAFARAEIQGDGPTRPLAAKSTVILEYPKQDFGMSSINPYWIFWVVAILFTGVTFFGHRKKRLLIGFDVVFFGILGLIGILVFFLWFGTEHTATKWNWNLLWAFPGHLLLASALLPKIIKPWVRKYLLFALIMADMAVVFWILGWESFHPSLIPILLVLILRTNYLYYNLGKYKQVGA